MWILKLILITIAAYIFIMWLGVKLLHLLFDKVDMHTYHKKT